MPEDKRLDPIDRLLVAEYGLTAEQVLTLSDEQAERPTEPLARRRKSITSGRALPIIRQLCNGPGPCSKK